MQLSRTDEDLKGWYLWLFQRMNVERAPATSRGRPSPPTLGSAWRVYLIESRREESLKPLAEGPTLIVTLLDKEGGAIKRHTRALEDHGRAKKATGYRWLIAEREQPFTDAKGGRRSGGERASPTVNVAVCPFMLSSYSTLIHVPGQTVRCKIALTAEEMRRVGEIRCEVVVGKPKKE